VAIVRGESGGGAAFHGADGRLMHANLIGIVLNLLALLATGAYVVTHLGARYASPVDRRLAALFTVLALLMSVRTLRWWLVMEPLRHLEESLAAFVPLFALLLAEGLLRRHAPTWLKQAICFGGLLFAVLALARPMAWALPFAYALGAFVSLSLISIALLLALRRRGTLSHAENDAISALSVGLLFALPLGATDFLAAAGVSPIRAGGLGMLFVLLSVARVTAVGGGWRGVLSDAFWALAASGLGFAAFALVFGAPTPLEALNIFTLILALVLTFRSMQHQIEVGRAQVRDSLWRTLATAPTETLDAFLAGLLAAPELQRARLIDGAALQGYDQNALETSFGGGAVLTVAEARAHEQISVLFDESESTHVILLAREPMRLLFVNLPSVGAGAETDLQLTLLAKLAQRIAHA
jgi:hypothetical protein